MEHCVFEPALGELLKNAAPCPEELEQVAVEAARKAVLFTSTGHYDELFTELKLMYAARFGMALQGAEESGRVPDEIYDAFSSIVKELANGQHEFPISLRLKEEIYSAIRALADSYVGTNIFPINAASLLERHPFWRPSELFLLPGGGRMFCLEEKQEGRLVEEINCKASTFIEELTLDRAKTIVETDVSAWKQSIGIDVQTFERVKSFVADWMNSDAVLNASQQRAVSMGLINCSRAYSDSELPHSVRSGALFALANVINGCRG